MRDQERPDGKARLGADVGGTFTDVVLLSEDGHRTTVTKVPSSPPAYEEAVIGAIDLSTDPEARSAIADVGHGTTVATNAVLERRGSRTALLTTAGFRDVLELRRLRAPQLYDLFWKKPPPLIERHLRYEVSERVMADGTVLMPLDEEQVRSIAAELVAKDVEAVAVTFLHSYLHPEHEQRVSEILEREAPHLNISISSAIVREQGEYERSATCAVNAYVRPLMERYIGRLRSGLAELGIRRPLRLMQSSGGVMDAADAMRRPVLALESGPAAGVVGALGIAKQLGLENVMTLDMGGTTAKASLIEAGAVSRSRDYEVGGGLSSSSRLIKGGGELLRIPSIAIAEIGAGGGSIAWHDAAGGFHVGPRSAGASPGPACYGTGGSEPTVTDANVALGYIPAGPVADGSVVISRQLAERAVGRVAHEMDTSMLDAARGIHELANARMIRALRAVSSEMGRDPADFALMAYGGSGPVHAIGLAEALGAPQVIVPARAGVFSAVGLLYARSEFHEVHTCHLDVRAAEPTLVGDFLSELRNRLEEALDGQPARDWRPSIDLRYRGQSWEIEVPLESSNVTRPVLAEAIKGFEDEHERLYGVREPAGAPIDVRAVRLAAIGEERAPSELRTDRAPARPGEAGNTRTVNLPTGGVTARSAARSEISERFHAGPLVIDEYDSTLVVPPSWSVRRHARTDALVLEPNTSGQH